MGRVFDINMSAHSGQCILGELRFDRAWFNQADENAGSIKLHPQGDSQTFDGMLGSVIGTTVAKRHETQDRRAVHDAAPPLSPHVGNDLPRQFMPAENIRFKLKAQHICRQILYRAGLAIGTIVEQRVDAAIRSLCNFGHKCIDRCSIRVIHQKRFNAIGFKGRQMRRIAHCCEDAPAFALQGAGAVCSDSGRTSGDDDAITRRHGFFPYNSIGVSHISHAVTTEFPLAEKTAKIRWHRLAFKVFYDAYCHFNDDDGWAMSSHVALSGLLALFPFLIFGTALAGFLGASTFSVTAIHLMFDTWPSDIAQPLAAEINRVLEIPRGGLLTISVLAAAYFASNGVEALRISLNRAYRVAEGRPWYLTRLTSLGYVIVAVVIFAAISIVLVAIPIAIRIAGTRFPWLQDELAAISNFGVLGTVIVLFLGLIVCHKYLPAGNRRVIDILPGILLTLMCWTGFAFAFASYLSTFANYAATYAGLASVMVVLVFLYMVGVIFMLGAEVNAALMKYRVYSTLKHARDYQKVVASDLEEPRKVADIDR